MNFTEEIKNEIISAPVPAREGAVCMLSAFIRTCGDLILRNGCYGFVIVTENERTAEFFTDIIENVFGVNLTVSDARFDVLTGRDKLAFECTGEKAQNLLAELGILGEKKDGKYINSGIDDRFFSDETAMTYYIKGAFLGSGSCTLPEENSYSRTGYHFEIVFSDKAVAGDFCEILAEFEVLAKLVVRKDAAVVYVKSKEVVSDLLNIMSCFKCLGKLSKVVEHKERQNNANRVTNCSVSNIDKTVTASVKQVRAIEIISETVGLKSLEKPVFDVAMCRLADTNASMRELSDRLGISKSCLNHRMRKILELAQSLSQD